MPPNDTRKLNVKCKQTILQVLPALDRGGVEMTTVEVNRAIVARGHRSLVVSSGGPLVKRVLSDGGEHFCLEVSAKTPLTLLKTFALRRLLVDQAVDVVNARSRMPAWIAYLAWRGMPTEKRPRLVTTVHGLNSVNWYSRIMTRGERVIAVSQWCRDYVLQNYPTTDPDKLMVISGGIDPKQFPFGYRPTQKWLDAWHTEYPQLQNRFVVLLPGRVTRVKGHFDFLDAIDQLKQSKIPVHGLIVGGEHPRRQTYAASLRAKIAESNLQNDITFTGNRDDLREIMAVSDVVVSTTADPPESFGRTVLEAVRLGRPTIGYDHGGVHEILESTYPEGLVPARDVAALAERIAQVFRQELPVPCVTNEFDLPAMLAKEIELYETIGSTAVSRDG